MEKYQEVNRIVEEILKHVGGEVRDLKSEGSLIGQTRLISVYSLADNQYQMPFAMTLSSILSENERYCLWIFRRIVDYRGCLSRVWSIIWTSYW